VAPVTADAPDLTPVFFLAGGTGISAEALGNALLQQFPTLSFRRHTYPFIDTVEEARRWSSPPWRSRSCGRRSCGPPVR